MKQITFIRHAKVDMDSSQPLYANELPAWEKAYNSAPILTDLPFENELLQRIKSADYVVSSTLRRTIDSLQLLGVGIDEKNRLFNEAAIPAIDGRLFKLKPVQWLALFRLFSLMGVGRWARVLRETKMDAQKAAYRLHRLSTQHDHVVLMGHGVMNWLIRKELAKIGWRREYKEIHDNWGSTVLLFDKR